MKHMLRTPKAVAAVVVSSACVLAAQTEETLEPIVVENVDRVESGEFRASRFELKSGSWTQQAGETYVDVAAHVGYQAAVSGSTTQRLTVAGGSFTPRRAIVGMANADAHPAEVLVTGGLFGSWYMLQGQDGDAWATGLHLGAHNLYNETVESVWPAGRITVTGGEVAFPALFFGPGCLQNGKTVAATESASQFLLRGGTFSLGKGGVSAPHLASTSYYDFGLSGGKLKAVETSAVSTDVRLSDRDGGVEIEVADGKILDFMTGSVLGTGSLKKTGTGTLQLIGGKAYTGKTTVNEGSLYVSVAGRFANWTADACSSMATGTSVGNWPTTTGSSSWSFADAAGALLPGTVPPTVAVDPTTGHRALEFTGENSLFLTGNSAQPVSGWGECTIALVLTVPEGTVGVTGEKGWIDSSVIVGTSMTPGDGKTSLLYGLALNANGQIGCGLCYWPQHNPDKRRDETIWSAKPINDGKPHVVVWSWQRGSSHSLWVDGDEVSGNTFATAQGGLTLSQVRLVLGGSEQAKSNTFKGRILALQMADTASWRLGRANLGARLARCYGVTLPEPPAVSLPTATAVWSADDLTGGAGSAVTDWACGNWHFTSALADAIMKTDAVTSGNKNANPPVIASDTVNGHKLVSFNGTSSALALTGGSPTPVSGADGLTVAMAVRFTGLGLGGENFTAATASAFFGESYSTGSDVQFFSLALSSAGRVGSCMKYKKSATESSYATARSKQRFLDDGEVHILVATYPNLTAAVADKVTRLSVDGTMVTGPCTLKQKINQTRILLGASEEGGKATYAPVDVAEFRVWKNTIFTEAQMNALTKEMGAKYGVQTVPDRTAGGDVWSSSEIIVGSGAKFGSASATGTFAVNAGQTLSCGGTIQGLMYVCEDGVVSTSAQSSVPVDALELEDGAVLRVCDGVGGTVNPIAVKGDLVLHPGTVKIDISGCTNPVGKILTWSGALKRLGETTFEVVGGKAAELKLDERGQSLKFTSGMVIIFR